MLPFLPSPAAAARRMRPLLIAKPAAITAASALASGGPVPGWGPGLVPISAAASPSRSRTSNPSTPAVAEARVESTETSWPALSDDELHKKLVQEAENARQGRIFNVEAIREDMARRPRRATYDFLSPTNSHLLNLALWDFLPPEARAGSIPSREDVGYFGDRFMTPSAVSRGGAPTVPHGHHLVYFPIQRPLSLLLPDGTDPAQSPGAPFVQRMWAGGSVHFKRPERLRLNGKRAVCVERIDAANLRVRGAVGRERVFVDVFRRYGPIDDVDLQLTDSRQMGKLENKVEADPCIEERRTLVFMRASDDVPESTDAELLAKKRKGQEERIVRAPREPEYSFKLTPSASLLFQFSALTYNAHAIHLDAEYCRSIEGHRGLLVHGPLTLVLMLSAVRARVHPIVSGQEGNNVNPARYIHKFEYRNLAPLYAGEELRVCVRRNPQERVGDREQFSNWDVWVENSQGSMCVRGTAVTRGERLHRDQNGNEDDDDTDEMDEDDEVDSLRQSSNRLVTDM